MVRVRKPFSSMALGGLAIATVVGCAPITVDVPVDFAGEGLTFDAAAGESQSKSGRVEGVDLSVQVGSGRISFDAADISVNAVEADEQKQAFLLQASDALEITVHIGPLDSQPTVCETGDSYGPFHVTLDENNIPLSISPSSVTLEDSTIELLNAGEFSYCIEVLSPVTAEIVIGQMHFSVGL